MGIPELLNYESQENQLARRMVAMASDVSRIFDICNINKLGVKSLINIL